MLHISQLVVEAVVPDLVALVEQEVFEQTTPLYLRLHTVQHNTLQDI